MMERIRIVFSFIHSIYFLSDTTAIADGYFLVESIISSLFALETFKQATRPEHQLSRSK